MFAFGVYVCVCVKMSDITWPLHQHHHHYHHQQQHEVSNNNRNSGPVELMLISLLNISVLLCFRCFQHLLIALLPFGKLNWFPSHLSQYATATDTLWWLWGWYWFSVAPAGSTAISFASLNISMYARSFAVYLLETIQFLSNVGRSLQFNDIFRSVQRWDCMFRSIHTTKAHFSSHSTMKMYLFGFWLEMMKFPFRGNKRFFTPHQWFVERVWNRERKRVNTRGNNDRISQHSQFCHLKIRS